MYFLKQYNNFIAQSNLYINESNSKTSAVLSLEIQNNLTIYIANNSLALDDSWPNIIKF